jgi:hypothetical protein
MDRYASPFPALLTSHVHMVAERKTHTNGAMETPLEVGRSGKGGKESIPSSIGRQGQAPSSWLSQSIRSRSPSSIVTGKQWQSYGIIKAVIGAPSARKPSPIRDSAHFTAASEEIPFELTSTVPTLLPSVGTPPFHSRAQTKGSHYPMLYCPGVCSWHNNTPGPGSILISVYLVGTRRP